MNEPCQHTFEQQWPNGWQCSKCNTQGVICPKCNGDGYAPVAEYQKNKQLFCSRCNGDGVVEKKTQ